MKAWGRIVALSLSVACLASLCSCKKDEPEGPADKPEKTEETEPVTEPSEDTEPSEETNTGFSKYIDDTRDLKDVYSLDEIFSEYAIDLFSSSLIVTDYDEYSFVSILGGINYEKNLYSFTNMFLYADDYDYYSIELEDTLTPTLDEFVRVYMNKPKGDDETPDPVLIEQTDDHAVINLSYGVADYDVLENSYYFAKVIGDNVYATRVTCAKDDEPYTEERVKEFIKVSEIIFDHLREDDGKTPYIYDMVLNAAILGDDTLTSFERITYIEKNYIVFNVNDADYCYLEIDPDEYKLSEEYGEWIEQKDIKVRKGQYGFQDILIVQDGKNYYFSLPSYLHEDMFKSAAEFRQCLEDLGAIG